MATQKQARAAEKRRHERLQAKIAARQARRQRRARVLAWTAILAVLLGGGTFGVLSSTGGDSPPEPSPTPSATVTTQFAPGPDFSEYRTWDVVIDTNYGVITATLDGAAAPQAVASFVRLAQKGYFDGTPCHRLVTDGIYILQCGDPTGTGTGGPGYVFGPVENAPEDGNYPAGTIAMARVGDDAYSMGSQFFFVYEDSPIPDDSVGGYTVFGQITEGLAIVEGIAAQGTSSGSPAGSPAEPVIVNEVTVS